MLAVAAHWSLRGLIFNSAEHCGADYKSSDRDRQNYVLAY